MGHVASLARPGGNVTGLALLQTDFGVKGLELLSEAVPAARRIAVLWNSGTPSHVPGRQALPGPARTLGVELQEVDAPTAADLTGAFAVMAGQHAQAVLALASPLFFAERRRVAELALTHRLPTMLQVREAVEAGGLMSYAPNYEDLFRRAATYVDKILKGAKPADLPVEQPTRFDLVVNLQTARALRLTIPDAVLQQATELTQ